MENNNKAKQDKNMVIGLFFGTILGLMLTIPALVGLTHELKEYKSITAEQNETIRRYEAVTAGYEELTIKLFNMLEGDE